MSLSAQPNSSALMPIDEFTEWWSNDKKTPYKYLRRRTILRIIWNKINASGYFKHLILREDFSDDCTYARRLLNYLSSTKPKEDDCHYENFYDLLKGVLDPLDKDVMPSPKEFINFAKTLLILNESRFDNEGGILSRAAIELKINPNYWCQLVVIKYTEKDLKEYGFTSTELAEKLKEFWIKKGSADCGVMITSAGQFFTYMINSLEFFACREAGDTPLVFVRDQDKIEEILTKVYKKVEWLADNIPGSEAKLFKSEAHDASYNKNYNFINASGKEVKHLLRVIKEHFYCSQEIMGVVAYYNKNHGKNYLVNGDDAKFIEFLNNHADKYNKLHKKLTKDGYFGDDEKF